MIRTVLRALGLLASLVSFMVLLTARGPAGESSLLERIPALMEALEARLDTKDRPAVAPPPSRIAPPRPSGPIVLTPTRGEVAPPPEATRPPGQELIPPLRMPGGDPGVKVNRGLP